MSAQRRGRSGRWAIGWLVAAVYGCTGNIGEGPMVPIPEGASAAVISGARRLTRTEYDATLQELLRDSSQAGFALLPEDVNDPFDNDYHSQKVSPALIEAIETLAWGAAERAVADPQVMAAILPCAPTGPEDGACLGAFVKSFGRRALRRPLGEAEVAEVVDQLQPFAVEGGDFAIGVKLAIATLLQDLEFIYRVERGAAVEGLPGVFRLSAHELATRLSYLFLGTTPPPWLLDRADQGGLATSEDLRAAAEELLGDPRAKARIERFHALWLGFHQLPHSPELVAELRAESRALIEKVIFEDHDPYFELFTSEQTQMSDYLAGHYGYTDATPGWYSYPDERRGILSHGAVLSSFGKYADTSPTQRGIFIRTRLLCQEIPPPPPDVDSDNPPSEGGDCKSDKYEAHNQGGCFNCHQLMDPIGFGLERYDNQGRFRTHDEGKPQCTISGEGSIPGFGEFNGPAELGALLVESGKLEACVVKQVYRFAHGRRETGADDGLLAELEGRFESSGHRFDQLLLDLVAMESFLYRRQEEVQP